MIDPAGAQRLEAAPAITDAHADAEDVAELAIEVTQAALWMMDDADGQIGEACQALGEQAHDDTLAATRIAMDMDSYPCHRI